MNYKQAVSLIAEKRNSALFNAEMLFNDALKTNPALLETEQKIRAIILRQAKGEKIDIAALEKLEKEKAVMLDKMGLNAKTLNPPLECAKCRDTGLINGGYCACAKKLIINDKKNLKIPLHNFSDADFTLYDENSREINKKIFSNIEKISSLYPDNKKRNILLLGPTGTGKTFLAGCAASKFLERGFIVTAVTAFDFVNRALSYHTTFDDGKLSHITPLLESDLLIIDDLGCESMLKNVTVEYLFTVLTERLYGDKLTLITSNLSKDGILVRYGERIYSRLFDKAFSYECSLTNSDVRLKK